MKEDCTLPRILIVDDEERWRETLGTFFETKGWNVATAANKTEALAQLTVGGKPFTVILSDNFMNGADEGLALLWDIRTAGHQMSFVLMTCDDGAKDRFRNPADFCLAGFIDKSPPTRIATIYDKVLEFIDAQ
jgi:DNA-binding NtrC family response regulator